MSEKSDDFDLSSVLNFFKPTDSGQSVFSPGTIEDLTNTAILNNASPSDLDAYLRWIDGQTGGGGGENIQDGVDWSLLGSQDRPDYPTDFTDPRLDIAPPDPGSSYGSGSDSSALGLGSIKSFLKDNKDAIAALLALGTGLYGAGVSNRSNNTAQNEIIRGDKLLADNQMARDVYNKGHYVGNISPAITKSIRISSPLAVASMRPRG